MANTPWRRLSTTALLSCLTIAVLAMLARHRGVVAQSNARNRAQESWPQSFPVVTLGGERARREPREFEYCR
jgi:hypothetical protein